MFRKKRAPRPLGEPAPPKRLIRRKSALAEEFPHLRDAIISVVIAIVIVVLIRQFVLGVYAIPSESMSPTVEAGDRIVVEMFYPETSGMKRGDVIVFSDPGGWIPDTGPAIVNPVVKVLRIVGIAPNDPGNKVVKRVIGLPGDRVVCCSTNSQPTVNGVPVPVPYLAAPGTPIPFDVTVPPGMLWVMGDNRDLSADSRLQATAFVPEANVVGRVAAVVWPLKHLAFLPR